MSSDENKQEQPATEKEEPAEQQEKECPVFRKPECPVFRKPDVKTIEKEQEAKLRAKYPGLNKPHGGSSAFLQKRLSKGQKYFDSGDYAMAKAEGNKKKAMPPADKLLIGSRGDAIPTPENLPPRKPSLVQSKLAAGMS